MNQTKKIIMAALGALSTLGLAGAVWAADGMAGMDMKGMPMQAGGSSASSTDQALTDAVVKQVDASTGMVTLQHGTMANIGMPAMTMAYKTATPSLLDEAKAGAHVKVRVENIHGNPTIVKLIPQ
ncbi:MULTISPECIES: copper-binding protein [Achromobacter]|uniref:copper-binding protein n=1 Tax=Achromobacter TaxID=222 RepID=UPI00244947B6|nr:copper-binding protein [Achromobacter animicus]MDH0684804.1 copper-binding protein [Achromobacter animicus]